MNEQDGRWVTMNGAHVFIKNGQSPMDAFIKQKGGTKKVDYKKYLEERDKTIDKFIATNGQVDIMSEEMVNKLRDAGVPEELLAHAYPLKDGYDLEGKMAENPNFLNQYIEYAKKNKQRDEKHWAEQIEWEKEKERQSKINERIDKMNYDGKGSKKYKDYDTDQVSYKIDNETLATITNDWAYKDETRQYFDTLDDKTAEAILDYTNENEIYNYKHYNNILNGHWEGRDLDDISRARVKLIDKAIENSTIDEDMYLYRNTSLEHVKDDMTMTSKGYLSTSLFKEDIEHFDEPDVFKIRVPKGTKGLYIGSNTMSWVDESEVLLGRNTTIKIIGRNKDGTIECEIIKSK